jgi:hypothetical protein
MTLLKIFMETRPAALDFFLRLVAIKEINARRHSGVAVRVRVNNVGSNIPWARKYRFQELTRNVPVSDLFGVENKEAV